MIQPNGALRLNLISANVNTTPTFLRWEFCIRKKYFKEELHMSNSSTSPVQYPLPYKVVGGCLYKEVTTKSGITTVHRQRGQR